VNIGLQDVSADLHGCAEGADGVLSVSGRKAAVRNNSGRLAVKIGHNSPLSLGVSRVSISLEDEQTRVRFGDD
jgi:hypothetical protein